MGIARGGRRRWLGAFALVLGSSLVLGMAPARTDPLGVDWAVSLSPIARPDLRDDALHLTNADRRAADLGDLAVAERVSRYATRHSRRMAQLGYVFHSGDAQLRAALEGTGWVVAGENVGVGPTLEDLERAFMASRPHRHNILGDSFDQVAVGVVESGGVLWITVVFYGG